MFTGLVEAVGRVAEVTRTVSSVKIRIRTPLAREMQPGDSIAINGVCLTAVSVESDELQADVGPETARVTTLGSLQREAAVNLERPVRADGRLGGHFVQGHVDDTGRVAHVRAEEDAHWLTIAFDDALAPYLILKGSIAVDGVSLTIAALREGTFDVMIIPFPWAQTNLCTRRVDDRVNLECDIIGKYVVRGAELARGIRPRALID